MNDQLLAIKTKLFGVKLASIRQKRGLSIDTLSQLTGIHPERINETEKGRNSLALPEVELLAMKLGIPADILLTGDTGKLVAEDANSKSNEDYMALRNRMIAVLLRKARTQQSKELDEMAPKCGMDTDELAQFESGKVPIPWPLLECLCSDYQIEPKSLFDPQTMTQTTEYSSEQSLSREDEIPGDLQDFIRNPANHPYLELARKLSEIDAARLRNIAEGILEITY